MTLFTRLPDCFPTRFQGPPAREELERAGVSGAFRWARCPSTSPASKCVQRKNTTIGKSPDKLEEKPAASARAIQNNAIEGGGKRGHSIPAAAHGSHAMPCRMLKAPPRGNPLNCSMPSGARREIVLIRELNRGLSDAPAESAASRNLRPCPPDRARTHAPVLIRRCRRDNRGEQRNTGQKIDARPSSPHC